MCKFLWCKNEPAQHAHDVRVVTKLGCAEVQKQQTAWTRKRL